MDEIKKIVASFVQISPEEVRPETVIDKVKLKSSILVHRMYAEIAIAGFKINNYNNIRTYRELLGRISGETKEPVAFPEFDSSSKASLENYQGVGIDIEEILKFPVTDDYRSHEFYRANFTEKEISYCILKENSRQSFAGLFSAKEAIRKSGDQFLNLSLNQIEIEHSNLGQPNYPGFSISISHNDNTSIAVALIKEVVNVNKQPNQELPKTTRPNLEPSASERANSSKIPLIVSILALAIAILSLALTIYG